MEETAPPLLCPEDDTAPKDIGTSSSESIIYPAEEEILPQETKNGGDDGDLTTQSTKKEDTPAEKDVHEINSSALSNTCPPSQPRPRSWGEISQSYIDSMTGVVAGAVQTVKEVGKRVIYSLAEVDPFSEASLSPTVHMLGIAYDVAPIGALQHRSMNSSSVAFGESATRMGSAAASAAHQSAGMVMSSLDASTMSQSSSSVLSEGARMFRLDMRSRFWFTYRSGLEPITAHGLTSDAGWGCMLRSAQMMFAQGLSVHWLGRDWRLQPDIEYDAMPAEYRRILEMFADHPSAPLSIHRIARAGEEVGKKAGQWLGPNTVCSALQRLHSRGAFGEDCNLQLLLFDSNDGDNTIYKAEAKAKLQKGPLFILLPVRLGTYTIDRSYVPKVAAVFQLPQSLGFIGGRPASAHYFVASRGSLVYFLDPHTTQPYVSLCAGAAGKDRHRSWHCEVQRRMNLRDIDASLTFGFYCRDEEDFDSLCDGILAMNMALGGYAAVSIAESRQQYDMQNAWDQDDDDDDDESTHSEGSQDGRAPLAAE